MAGQRVTSRDLRAMLQKAALFVLLTSNILEIFTPSQSLPGSGSHRDLHGDPNEVRVSWSFRGLQGVSAAPVAAPNVFSCTGSCCPPKQSPKLWSAPTQNGPIKTRLSFQTAFSDPAYVAKYTLAYQKLRELQLSNPSDPRGWLQQANVHCAYCANTYGMDIHRTWLFFPWHRWYLYFHERILGSLIGDPTFTLPFWNWDNTAGRAIPAMFLDKSSVLYNANRNNLNSIYNQIASSCSIPQMQSAMLDAQTTSLFLGKPPGSGSAGGSVELGVHGAVHIATGLQTSPYVDMGSLASAGKDPVFYAHHLNIDRLWWLWLQLPPAVNGNERANPTSTDWLNSQFAFYDENAQLVIVSVKDAANIEQSMGITYEALQHDWYYTPTPSPSPSPSAAPVPSPSASPLPSPSASPLPSPSTSPLPSPPASPLPSPSASPLLSPSISPSPSPSKSASPSQSATPSPSASSIPSPSASQSPAMSPSPSRLASPSASAGPSPSGQPSASPLASPSSSPNPSPSTSPKASQSPSPLPSSSSSPLPTPSPSPEPSALPSTSASPVPSPSASPIPYSPYPSSSPASSSSPSPSSSPPPSPSSSPLPSSSPYPSSSSFPPPSPSTSPLPSSSPYPSSSPSPIPSSSPVASPSSTPYPSPSQYALPSPSPIASPWPSPEPSPSPYPSSSPAASSSPAPSPSSSSYPSPSGYQLPSPSSSASASPIPSPSGSPNPSLSPYPSMSSSPAISASPVSSPSASPNPSSYPSPSVSFSPNPSQSPKPSSSPLPSSSSSPNPSPSNSPSPIPSSSPLPSNSPANSPAPSVPSYTASSPSQSPKPSPSSNPSPNPSRSPNPSPSQSPKPSSSQSPKPSSSSVPSYIPKPSISPKPSVSAKPSSSPQRYYYSPRPSPSSSPKPSPNPYNQAAAYRQWLIALLSAQYSQQYGLPGVYQQANPGYANPGYVNPTYTIPGNANPGYGAAYLNPYTAYTGYSTQPSYQGYGSQLGGYQALDPSALYTGYQGFNQGYGQTAAGSVQQWGRENDDGYDGENDDTRQGGRRRLLAQRDSNRADSLGKAPNRRRRNREENYDPIQVLANTPPAPVTPLPGQSLGGEYVPFTTGPCVASINRPPRPEKKGGRKPVASPKPGVVTPKPGTVTPKPEAVKPVVNDTLDVVEVLVIQGLCVPVNTNATFQVYLELPQATARIYPDDSRVSRWYVGQYVHVPMMPMSGTGTEQTEDSGMVQSGMAQSGMAGMRRRLLGVQDGPSTSRNVQQTSPATVGNQAGGYPQTYYQQPGYASQPVEYGVQPVGYQQNANSQLYKQLMPSGYVNLPSGYQQGSQPGYQQVYQPGYPQGNHQQGYGQAYQTGYGQVNQVGYQPGYQTGYQPGYQQTYVPGYQQFNQPGYQPGYQSGYQPINIPPNQQVQTNPVYSIPGGYPNPGGALGQGYAYTAPQNPYSQPTGDMYVGNAGVNPQNSYVGGSGGPLSNPQGNGVVYNGLLTSRDPLLGIDPLLYTTPLLGTQSGETQILEKDPIDQSVDESGFASQLFSARKQQQPDLTLVASGSQGGMSGMGSNSCMLENVRFCINRNVIDLGVVDASQLTVVLVPVTVDENGDQVQPGVSPPVTFQGLAIEYE